MEANKESCGRGRNCSTPGDVCNEFKGVCESSPCKPFCNTGKQLRGTYINPSSSMYSARPSVGDPTKIHYDGTPVGTCGPEPAAPIPCGPLANQQCPWNRGSDMCCHVDPLQNGRGFCDVCEKRNRTGKLYVFSPDTFMWSVTT